MMELAFLEEKDTGFPLFQQLKKELIHFLEKENYKPGARFLSYRQIASAADVSRITAQKAIHELIREGYLEERENGIVVAEAKAEAVRLNYGVILSPWDNGIAMSYDNGIILAAMLDGVSQESSRLELIPYSIVQRPYEQFKNYIASLKLDCLIWLGMRRSAAINAALINAEVKQICLQNRPENLPVPFLAEDNRKAAAKAARTLLQEGYRNIAVIHSPGDIGTYRERLNGVNDAIRESGMPEDAFKYLELPETPRQKWYYYTVKSFLEQTGPDAVLLLTHAYNELERFYGESGLEFPQLISFELPEIIQGIPKFSFRYFLVDYSALGKTALGDYPLWSGTSAGIYEKLLPMELKTYKA